ncbi:MAG: HAD family phosphatase [Paludibacteraceae bacterium]|nr:HAD family phosphatase [Paludibacteraceae bacterium]
MIKHIFLDLGMVTVRLCMQRCIDAFKLLGIHDVDRQITNCRQHGIFNGIELGLVSVGDFHQHVRQQYAVNVTDEQIDAAWNAFILDSPVALQQLVHRLHSRYNTYILSNTNQIHFEFWANRCMGGEGGYSVDECFNKCYLSNELHLAKPDPEIYKAVLADCGADAAECLYLDDNLANVEAACKLGWNASVSSSPEQTIDILTRFEQTGLY